MDLVKQTKDITNTIGDKIEKGIDIVKEELANVIKPFANLLKQDDNSFKIEIDLPGVKKEDIDLTIDGNRLTISAQRKMKKEISTDDYYLCENRYGLISRSFLLPDDIDKDKIEARYEDGRLYITLEQEESKKPKSIAVK